MATVNDAASAAGSRPLPAHENASDATDADEAGLLEPDAHVDGENESGDESGDDTQQQQQQLNERLRQAIAGNNVDEIHALMQAGAILPEDSPADDPASPFNCMVREVLARVTLATFQLILSMPPQASEMASLGSSVAGLTLTGSLEGASDGRVPVRKSLAPRRLFPDIEMASIAVRRGPEFLRILIAQAPEQMARLVACVDSSNELLIFRTRDAEVIDLLGQLGADMNDTNSWGLTPLYQACNSRNADLVRALLKHGANPNIGSALPRFSAYPVHAAAGTFNAGVLQLLHDAGADFNIGSILGFTPVFSCVAEISAETSSAEVLNTLQVLHRLGCNLNHINSFNENAINTLAGLHAPTVILDSLLQFGLDPTLVSSETNMSPLHAACATGDVELVRALLAHGISPDSLVNKPDLQVY
ncbi:hypothetical protein CAOG_01721 [Capsaspora owczarzaki ATCC 30864]|nr:hypothetical protein CAOG_01721 [Capsaspora owczarzaki ATCC 30864]|eukprot:XP_004364589.1 hypothetical protein CAOG_01721 [Capsaspora owczarzaki ATCC 30864]